MIGAPVHAERLLRERVDNAWAAAEPHPDLLSASETSVAKPYGLACVGEPGAMTALEKFAVAVKDRNAAATAARPAPCSDSERVSSV